MRRVASDNQWFGSDLGARPQGRPAEGRRTKDKVEGRETGGANMVRTKTRLLKNEASEAL